MFGIDDAIVGSLGAAAIGGGLSFLGQSSANSANRDAAREQMAFQERMDNTKYQRAVKDLVSAGLNPMMAYGNMSVGSPSGALGVGAQNAMAGVGQAVSEVGSRHAEISKKAAEMENLRESNKQIQANTAATEAVADKTRQDTKTSAAAELVNLGQVAVQKAQINASSAAAARDIAQARNLEADNAKKGMMSNIYDIGEAITRWGKEKVQQLHRAIPNIEIIHNPGRSK